MATTAKGKLRRRYSQTAVSDCTPEHILRFNALRHGLNSGYVLIPGDNVAAFRTQRRRLFEHYQPRNVEEAQCVELIAAGLWRFHRAGLEQSGFAGHLGAVMDGHPDVTGPACDPDPHRLHHRATDCSREATRWLRSVRHARADLKLMQKQRAERFIGHSAAQLEDYRVFLAEGEPIVPWDTGKPTPAGPQPSAVSASSDRRTRENRERTPPRAESRFPKHWSRRQRAAAQRRATRLATERASPPAVG